MGALRVVGNVLLVGVFALVLGVVILDALPLFTLPTVAELGWGVENWTLVAVVVGGVLAYALLSGGRA